MIRLALVLVLLLDGRDGRCVYRNRSDAIDHGRWRPAVCDAAGGDKLKMRSPCYDCDLLMADKGNAACTNCRDRIDYVNGISRARHFIREEKMENMNRTEPTSIGTGTLSSAPEASTIPNNAELSWKECKKCHQVKALEAFPQNKECANGREGSCKECRLKYRKDQYHARKRKIETEKNQAVIQKHLAKKRGKETVREPLEAKPEIEPAAEPAKAPPGFDILLEDIPEYRKSADQICSEVLENQALVFPEFVYSERLNDYIKKVHADFTKDLFQSVQRKIDSLEYERSIDRSVSSPDTYTLLQPGEIIDPAFIHGDLTIHVDFSNHPELHDFLCRTAAREFRPVVYQLLFWISGIYEANKIADA